MNQKGFVFLPLLILIVVASLGYLIFKNINPNTNTNTPEIAPTTTSNELTRFDQMENWKTYSNVVYSLKLPSQFNYSDIEYVNPSQMLFSWSEPRNSPKRKSLQADIGYVINGDPQLEACKTNEECYNGISKSFAVGKNGYKQIYTEIEGKRVAGFEKISEGDTDSPIFWYYFPLSHDKKFFAIDFQIHTSTIEEARELLPIINQILSTLEFKR